MLESYRSVRSTAEATVEVKKSRFIARVGPVDSEEAAMRFIDDVKEKHPEAAHNVFAFEVGLERKTQRFSDDGEPGGTAGKPVLEVLRAHNLVNTVIVVTRYFGGTLLGAGGLIRAYSRAANEGIKAAGPVEMYLHHLYQIRFDYPWLGKIEHVLRKDCVIRESTYASDITMKVLVPHALRHKILDELRNITSATIEIELRGTAYVPRPA